MQSKDCAMVPLKTYKKFLSTISLVILVTLVIFMTSHAMAGGIDHQNSGFFNQRYKGWLWFEEKEKIRPEDNKTEEQDHAKEITSQEAQRENEELKARLDEKRSIMIARPSPEAVRDYMYYEKIMWEKALALDGAYRQAKFQYPEYFDRLKDPQNVHAVKLKRKLEQESLEGKIKDFGKKFDLVFFSRATCKYCHEFAPILKRFGEFYGFNIEEVSLQGDLIGSFPGKYMPDLAVKLGIEATPSVVAISKDRKTAFELIRGYAAYAELEEYVGLAGDYVKGLKK